ncbi:MAG: flagellar hook-length control protein FliK [Rhodocyclaceae bacterium]|nr:flagellar hook-length control protein FliK [Rhodocyclaceae bacterium]
MKMLTESTVRSTEPVRPLQADPPPLQPGDRFRATILDRNSDGAYRAQASGQQLTLRLPTPAKPGDQLDLVVTGRESPPSQEGRPPTVLARFAENPPRHSDSPLLSSAAKLIGSLLADTTRTPPVALAGGAPLTNSAETPPSRIASALRDAVTRSGVFYESHQADWLEGKIPLAALRTEPQAQLPPGSRLAVPGAEPESLSTPANAPELPGASRTHQTVGTGPHLGENVTEIVHKQLDTLANQQLAWQVQPWPGQFMEWEIDAPDDQDGPPIEGAEREWRTRLRLQLPSLGPISAELAVTGDRIGIRLHAEEHGSDRLRDARPALATAFDAAGLRLVHATVSGHE